MLTQADDDETKSAEKSPCGAAYARLPSAILTCDPMLNVVRVKARVIGGKHDVPKEKVIDRYWKSCANVPAFFRLCDICHIYDNTEKLFRICRKHKNEMTFYQNDYWPYEKIDQLVFGRSEK